jgi:hypothetical protein
MYEQMDAGTMRINWHYGLEVDSATNRNEYQESSWGLSAAAV